MLWFQLILTQAFLYFANTAKQLTPCSNFTQNVSDLCALFCSTYICYSILESVNCLHFIITSNNSTCSSNHFLNINGVRVFIFISKQINTNIIFYFNFVIKFRSNRELNLFKTKLLNKLFLNIWFLQFNI